MDQTPLQDSIKFPPGYGDFALHCSDNVICHFPRHLLEYMSPVFKDMFNLAAEATNGDSRTNSSQPPLKLTETSAVIEVLLEHIDPKSRRAYKIDPDTILELLDAAQKYQISSITEWFEEQAGLQQINAPSGFISEPFISLHPKSALECALRFDFPLIGQWALRELAGTPSSTIKLDNVDLKSRVYKHQRQLRDVRVERYRGYISKVSVKFGSMYLTKPCSSCLSLACQWIIGMERAIADSPRWDSFVKACESAVLCNNTKCGASAWSFQFRGNLAGWEEEAKNDEAKLPEWPY